MKYSNRTVTTYIARLLLNIKTSVFQHYQNQIIKLASTSDEVKIVKIAESTFVPVNTLV